MDKYINNLNKRIGRTIKKQQLLQEGDKILIALSGGKDSMILLNALSERIKHIPFKVDLVASHVLIETIGYETDTRYLEQFCEERGVKFVLKSFEIELDKDAKKTECFLCSWHRRKALFELTKDLGCNKLAFGHHMDDALQTLLMNMMYHGSISSMPFQFEMFGGRIKVIRPMLEISEEELEKYQSIANYKRELKHCPFENTKRIEMKDIINNLNKMHPVAKKNMFRSMDKIFPEYLPHWKT